MTSLQHHGLIYDMRPLAEADKQAAVQLYQQPEACLVFEPLTPVTLDNVEVDMECALEDGGQYYGIFHPTGPLVGIISYIPARNPDSPGSATITKLFLAASYRQEGLGEAVVRAIEMELRREPELRKVLVGVQSKNAYALQFWKVNGYELTSGAPFLPAWEDMSIFEKEFAETGANEWGIRF